LVGLALLLVAGCNNGEQALNDANKVTICHATSSATNPYTRNRVAKDGALSGHDGHPNDIIPAFDYLDNKGVTQHYPGRNLESGQAILDNGCRVPGSTTPIASDEAETTENATNSSSPETDDSTGSEDSTAATDDSSDSEDSTPATDDSTGSDGTPGPTTTASRQNTPTSLGVAGPSTPTTTATSGPTTTSATSSGGVPPASGVGTPGASSTPTTTVTGQAEAESPAGLGPTTAAGQSAAPTSTGDNALAETGSSSTSVLIGALLLVLLGTLGVVIARRPKLS
jgi:cobalamin biosynthesis Mg chelatase CobN